MINTENSYRQGVEYILAYGSITAWCVRNGHSRRIRIISRISSCGNVQSRHVYYNRLAPRASLFSEVDSTECSNSFAYFESDMCPAFQRYEF